ncbi:hypothetical protein T08_6338 [Trichinella sp. T8]|nr:hypothetical protein T08_6338 [Trichinella sp. T8]
MDKMSEDKFQMLAFRVCVICYYHMSGENIRKLPLGWKYHPHGGIVSTASLGQAVCSQAIFSIKT